MGSLAAEIARPLIAILVQAAKKSYLCRSSANKLRATVEDLLPIVDEIRTSGVKLPEARRSQLDRVRRDMEKGIALCQKIMRTSRWNAYRNYRLARELDQVDAAIKEFIQKVPLHILAEIHQQRISTAERFNQLEGSLETLQQVQWSTVIIVAISFAARTRAKKLVSKLFARFL